MSAPERKLWTRLRGRRLEGLRFRRQHPIGGYAADFFCDEAQLVVELDGGLHRERRDHDARRDEFMRGLGLEILRFAVSDFERDVDGALAIILRVCRARIDEAGKQR